MEQRDYTRKKRHINAGERTQIELLLKMKRSVSEIAKEPGRDKSVISRELKRNSVEQMDSEFRARKRYFADAAQRQYEERRAHTCEAGRSEAQGPPGQRVKRARGRQRAVSINFRKRSR